MADIIVTFQSQLSGVMEAVFKAALFEITRLVEESFLEEVTRCREQVKTLQRKLRLSESRRKRREADSNPGRAEQTVQVQTDLNIKQENVTPEEVNSPETQQEVKHEENTPNASQSTCDQSEKLNTGKKSSDLSSPKLSDDKPGTSSQFSDPNYQLNWEDNYEQKLQSEQNGESDHTSETLFQNRYDMDNLDDLNNPSYKESPVTGIDDADDDDDDLVYMGPYGDNVKPPAAEEQLPSLTGEGSSAAWSSTKTSEDIDCLLINEEGHLQDPDYIHSDHVDSNQNVRGDFNCDGNVASERTDDMLGEPNTITDISQMIEMLQQQSMENGLYTCNLCLATFPDSATLKAHKQTHKEPERGLPYLCNQRRKTLNRSCNLKTQGPHHCNHCGKAFPSLFKLQKHRCEQMGDKPYTCVVCGNKFSRLWNLKLHQRIHTQEKPHHCSMCDKSFTRADILKVHQRTHTGERPYCCLVCGLSFKRLDHLKSHQRKHMPDQ